MHDPNQPNIAWHLEKILLMLHLKSFVIYKNKNCFNCAHCIISIILYL